MAADLVAYRARIGSYHLSNPSPKQKHVARTRHCNRTTYNYHSLCFLASFYLAIRILQYAYNPLTAKGTNFKSSGSLNIKTKHAYIALACLYLFTLLLLHDIHPNPGPRPPLVNQVEPLSTFFLNARSLKSITTNQNKLIEFKHLLYLTQPMVMAVCETWLTNKVSNTQIDNTKTYEIYRKDRPLKRGGGVMCMVNNSIRSDQKDSLLAPSPVHNEIIVVEVEPSIGNKLAIIVAYRSQKDPPPIFLQNFETTLNNCINANYQNILVMGDFNFKDITWQADLDTNLPLQCQRFMDTINRFGLTQLNNFPSRRGNDNILDLILTNFAHQFTQIYCNTYSYTSDHFLLDFDINCTIDRLQYPKRTILNFKKADKDLLTQALTTFNHKITQSPAESVLIMWDAWSTKLLDLIALYVPKLNLKNSNSPPWFDIELNKLVRKKNTLLKQAKAQGTKNAWTKFKSHRNRLKNQINYKHRTYLIDLSENLGDQPKKFWSMLKSETKSNMHPTKIIFNGMEANNPAKVADLLNQFFHSIFAKHDNTFLPPPITAHIDPNLSNITITSLEVLTQLSRINVSKAPGPDNIPTKILKDYAPLIVDSITTLFNKSLTQGKLPPSWKHANVIPLHKKGSKSQATNYRPISLLPIISKILERCLYNKIIDFILPKLAAQQHGFLRGRSTTTQLLSVLTNINNILDKGDQTDVIYFDLSKAFDSVPHHLLIHKLKSFGINGKLLDWLSDYLTSRFQRVLVNGTHSAWLPVTSGVPQGSILGPLLFLLYINDLPTVLSHDTICAIFADDTKICRHMRTQHDFNALQLDINNLHAWSKVWGLKFNETKCTVLSIKRNHKPTLFNYTMANAPLPRETNMNDLGIIVNEHLKWNNHIDNICTKANQRLWLVYRTLGNNTTQKAKLVTYMAMVRSLLEYATPVWSPNTKENLIRLESIQRKGTNYILSNPPYDHPNHISYKERLIACNLLPTSYRREFYDIIFFLKSLRGMVHFKITDHISFTQSIHNRRTRMREMGTNLAIPKTKLESTAHFYPTRIARLWNTLPPELRTKLISLESFNTIKKHLSKHYNTLLHERFDGGNTCTWLSICRCVTCRP